MIKTNRIQDIVSRVDTSRLRNNTQRVLLQMLSKGDEWIERTALKVPSAASRIRDLRMERFGGFTVECQTARQLGRNVKDGARRFYRLAPSTITLKRLNRIFEGVINTAK